MVKVAIIESERGWGQKIDGIKEFETQEEAVNFCKEYNKDLPDGNAPDWYMQAVLM